MDQNKFERATGPEQKESEAQESANERSPEEQARIETGARDFDAELDEILSSKKAEGLSPEELENLKRQFGPLDHEAKADIIDELKAEEKRGEGEKSAEENAEKEYEKAVDEYESAAKNLSERAAALGMEIPADRLVANLEKIKKAKPEAGETPDWMAYFNEQFGMLNEKLNQLEAEQKAGALTPERREQAKKEISSSLEDLTAKMTEAVIKLTFKILKGVFKGLRAAIKPGGESPEAPAV